jgi:hypothetical protein
MVQSLTKAVQARKDAEFAADIRAWRPHAVAHLSDDDLTEAVTEAREAAAGYGIADPQLRARFVMLGVAVAPGFWRYREIEAILLGHTGTPDIRFGDVCAMVAAGFRAAGRDAEIWWR